MAAPTATPENIQHDLAARNEMLLTYYPLVQRIANRMATSYGLPTGFEPADLVSSGVFGLIEAWERFDPERGVPFESYAIPRVKGAIVDAIRGGDWVPRKVRDRARNHNETVATLTTKLGRAPTAPEVQATTGDPQCRKSTHKVPVTLLALEATVADGSLTVADSVVDDAAEQPGFAIEDAELRRGLLDALHTLPERDRLILTLYYFQGMQLAGIAKTLGITESRVSQIHMRALQSLRARLQEDQSA